MEIIEYQEAGKLVVEISGRVDATSANRAETLLLSAAEKTTGALVVHLDAVSFMSSAGLRALLATGKKLKANGQELRLAAPGKQVKDLFELSGFDALFPVFDSLSKATK